MNAITIHTPQMSVPDVERVANAIANGGLFGSKDPNAVLTLCLLAQAEGQHPAVVFRDYHIINGKPAKKADAMLRDFITSGGKVEWHQLDDDCADATFRHPSGSARIEWTVERARQAGIANPMWKKYPRQMLRSRVISEGVRTVYPGATSGLYEVEEVQSMQADHAEPINITPEPRITADEPKPEPRQALDGPYSSPSKLKAAIKAFAEALRTTQDDLAGFNAWMATDEVIELERAALRYLPGWWETGDGMPPEFEPISIRIQRKARELEELDSIANSPAAQNVRAG
jgi:hypothetical protein